MERARFAGRFAGKIASRMHHEFCIKHDEVCIQNDELCIGNEQDGGILGDHARLATAAGDVEGGLDDLEAGEHISVS